MKEVILISGKARSGKDTFGVALKEALEERKQRVLLIHYADFLKFFCNRYLGWAYGDKSEQGRRLLQKTGTEIFRKNYEDCWVDIMVGFLRGCSSEYDYVIIPDTRFPNEIQRLKEINVELYLDNKHFADFIRTFRVERPNFVNDLTEEQKNHPSETALDNYVFGGWYINKGESLEELKKDAELWADFIMTGEHFLVTE